MGTSATASPAGRAAARRAMPGLTSDATRRLRAGRSWRAPADVARVIETLADAMLQERSG